MGNQYSQQPVPARKQRPSWKQGFRWYMSDPHAKSLLRLVLRHKWFAALAPFVTEILTPLIGPLAWGDNVVSWSLLFIAVIRMFGKVEYYRNNPPPEYWRQQQ